MISNWLDKVHDTGALTNNTHASYFVCRYRLIECVDIGRMLNLNMRKRKYKSNAQSNRRIYSRKESRKTNFGNANGWQQHSPQSVGINSPSASQQKIIFLLRKKFLI